MKLYTSKDTEEHPSVIHRPIKYPVEIRHALSLPVSASTHFVTPTHDILHVCFHWRKFKFTSTKLVKTDSFIISFSSEGVVKLFKTSIHCKNAKKELFSRRFQWGFNEKPGAKNPLVTGKS